MKPEKHKRPLPAFIRKRLNLTRIRQKLWREQRPRMLAFLDKARSQMQVNRQRRSDSFLMMVCCLPDECSPDELSKAIVEFGYVREFASFRRRVTKYGLMSYDADARLWRKTSHLI